MKRPPPSEHEIAAAVEGALLPHPFAPRRDLEVAGAVHPGAAACCFFDAFWPAEGRLAVAVARVHRGGLEGALRAAGLQRLLRALLALEAEPGAAVSAARDLHGRAFDGPRADLLVATFDARSGRIARAGRGRVSAFGPERVARGAAGQGAVVWLVAGDGDIGAPPGSEAALASAARGLAERSGPGSAAVGLLVRAGRPPAPGRSFAVPNDLPAVARTVEAVEAALTDEGAPAAVAAALALAVDELLTNIVLYGFADGGRHEILVHLAAGPGEAEICLRDDGRAFDPLSAPAPDLAADLDARGVGGLGIHFARTLLDGIDYSREKGWNVLRLRKRFPRGADAVSSRD